MKIWKLTYLIKEKEGRKKEGKRNEERKGEGRKKGRKEEGRKKEGKRNEERKEGRRKEGKNKGRCYSITPADSNSYSTTDNRELERQMTMYFIST